MGARVQVDHNVKEGEDSDGQKTKETDFVHCDDDDNDSEDSDGGYFINGEVMIPSSDEDDDKKTGVRAWVRRCCRPLRRYRRRARRQRAIAAATNSDAVKYIIGLSSKSEKDLTRREADLRTVILADRWSSVNTTEFHVAKSRE